MIKAEKNKTIGEDKIMNKAGTGEHNELANLHCMSEVIEKNKVPRGLNNAGHRARDSLWRSTGYRRVFGDSGLLSDEQDFPVEHCSQKWKSTVANCAEEH